MTDRPIPAVGPFPFPNHQTMEQILYPGRLGQYRQHRDRQIQRLFDSNMAVEKIARHMLLSVTTVNTAVVAMGLRIFIKVK